MKTSRLIGLAVLASAVLSGCAISLDGDTPQSTLDPAGPWARLIDRLSDAVFIVAGFVFVLVMGAAIYIIWRFRDRGDRDKLPEQIHGNTKLEVGWTIIPAVILIALAIPTVATVLELAEIPDEGITVEVFGQQWWWEFAVDLDNDGESDYETAGDLVIPVDTPIALEVQARDVIHSYWIPALNGKKDAVPGRVHEHQIEASEMGTFRGQCTEYCGLSHAYMQMTVMAVDAETFEEYAANQMEPAAEPEDGSLAAAGQEVFEAQCASCHLIEGLNDDTYEGAAQVSGVAPNLTHFATRGHFAGAIFPLWRDLDGSGLIEYEEIGGELNRTQLEAWLRDPPAEKPMAPEPYRIRAYGRGMPDLGLTEAQIDQLVAYLEILE